MRRFWHMIDGELVPCVPIPEVRERLEELVAEHKRTNVAPRKRDRALYKGASTILEETDDA